ncbi:MAG TPA: hypothetical protein VFV81_03635 [Verrucomicrobiae bacterium]|nr:hypothetical protein [Verrucomicrobiae bacterium]
MTLDVDGTKFDAADDAVIVRGFASINRDEMGASLVVLLAAAGNSLTTAGTPDEGWGGILLEENGVTRGAKIPGSLPQEKIIEIFQAYRRGEDAWKKEFQWDLVDSGRSNWQNLLLLAVVVVAILWLSHGCTR